MHLPSQWLRRSVPWVTAFGAFIGCGGVADPDLFGSAGNASAASQGNPGGRPGTAGSASIAGNVSSGGSVAPLAGASSIAGAAALGGNSGSGTASGGTGQGGASGAGASSAGGSTGGAPTAGRGGGTSSGAGAGGSAGASSGSAGASSGSAGASSGSAGASSGGAGAGGGSAGTSCAELFTLAGQQLLAAQTCNIAMSAQPCTGRVNNTCGCEVPVHRDDSKETAAYLKTLARIEEQNCSRVCTAALCPVVKTAMCSVTTPGSTSGKCSAMGFGAL